MLVLWYSFTEWGAPSGYMRRMVVWEPASLSKPRTGALFILETAEGEDVDQNPAGFFRVPFPPLSNCSLPNDDIVAVDVRSEVAPVKDPSAAHHHAPPASATAAQGGRQAGLGQGGQSLGQMSLAALEPQGRGQVRGHQPVPLHKHWDVKETR